MNLAAGIVARSIASSDSEVRAAITDAPHAGLVTDVVGVAGNLRKARRLGDDDAHERYDVGRERLLDNADANGNQPFA